MRAREWAIVGATGDPAAYGIPDLPTWRVHRDADGIAFVADDDDEPFILAESPVRVRR
jgi:hypothetical protein